MERALNSPVPLSKRFWPVFRTIAIVYVILLLGQQAGLEPGRIVREMIDNPVIIVQQLIVGLANAAIITIVALGYTMVYGIVESINFAHSSVFMLTTFVALLTMSWLVNAETKAPLWVAIVAFIPAMAAGGLINGLVERYAYRSLRKNAKIVGLIAGLGMDFVLKNIPKTNLHPNAISELRNFENLGIAELRNFENLDFRFCAILKIWIFGFAKSISYENPNQFSYKTFKFLA